MFFLSLLLIGIALWIVIDLSYGRIVHLRRVRSRSFPLRQSDFHLYTYGKDLYDALFTDIKQAKHHVHVLFFIVKRYNQPGILKLLIDKAKEGIEVRLLLDRLGSHHLSNEAVRSCKTWCLFFILSQSKVSFSFLFCKSKKS